MTPLCQLNNHNSVYVLEVIRGLNRILQSDPVNSISHLKIYDLPGSRFFGFRIISLNRIGNGSSSLVQFCKF